LLHAIGFVEQRDYCRTDDKGLHCWNPLSDLVPAAGLEPAT
jgi:hypothetical protein